jgi:hypothetical protein
MIMMSTSRAARWSFAALALGLLASPGFAQSKEPAPAPPAAPQATAPSPAQKKLDGILARHAKAHDEWEDAMQAATSQKERGEIYAKRPGAAFLDEIEEVAKEAKGTRTAAHAWAKFAVIADELGNVKQVSSAVEILIEDHITSPHLAVVPDMLDNVRVARGEKAERWLREMIEKSPERTVQAPAMFALGSRLVGGKKSTDEQKAEGRAMLERVSKEYSDVKSPYGEEYAAKAKGQLFEIDYLQIGKTPPDFEAIDENGVAFKLSDYRGKVVVIDFWGNW